MFKMLPLSSERQKILQHTISPNAFYMLVGDALTSRRPLSVVRMGDGEKRLIDYCQHTPAATVIDPALFENGTLKKLGCEGITCGELMERMCKAAAHCSYFAPSISGIQRPEFDLYSFAAYRESYVDNFFVNAWDEEMKIQLFRQAKHVLFIHRNAATADAMQIRAKGGLGVRVTFLKLDNWRETDSVIEKARDIDSPLVLFSAGPAGKYIGPQISVRGHIPKVAIDLGNTADSWTLSSFSHIQRA